jgi:hypothetical protein
MVVASLLIITRCLFPAIALLIHTLKNSSYIKNSRGFNTPKYELQATINDHIPEWLPMYGKKVRIFYHGMMRQCNGCYKLGHMKWECKEEKSNWKTYVATLRSTGNFEDVLFGSWLDERSEEEKMDTGKTQDKNSEEDLRNLLQNSAELRKAMKTYIDKNKAKKPQEPRPRSRDRSRSNERYNRNKRERSRSPYRGPNHNRGGRSYSNPRGGRQNGYNNRSRSNWQDKRKNNDNDRRR